MKKKKLNYQKPRITKEQLSIGYFNPGFDRFKNSFDSLTGENLLGDTYLASGNCCSNNKVV
jgi:hypothetical protein